MKKSECKGLTPAQLSAEIKEIFIAHVEIVGDPNLKWERLFRFMVMENVRFPADEAIEGICTDFFSAIHSGEVERFGTSIEAHLRAFGIWFPRYWRDKTNKRSFEALYNVPQPEIPVGGRSRGWNQTSLTIGQIRETLRKYDALMEGENMMRGVRGASGFIARCRESLRKYNELHGSNEA